jgi:hypothetical protein
MGVGKVEELADALVEGFASALAGREDVEGGERKDLDRRVLVGKDMIGRDEEALSQGVETGERRTEPRRCGGAVATKAQETQSTSQGCL